ncbi:hypothetical protein [Pandoravirus japonicus]|uniref:Uncharacterized protein n=1 Tax=Pandoravirus japonicus TaxID=2823154 RepID=A0A811BPV2_9VIRU|nr:hypothetical protein [Pandoravirus japonicus]
MRAASCGASRHDLLAGARTETNGERGRPGKTKEKTKGGRRRPAVPLGSGAASCSNRHIFLSLRESDHAPRDSRCDGRVQNYASIA